MHIQNNSAGLWAEVRSCVKRGGRPGLPVPNKPDGLCERRATFGKECSPYAYSSSLSWHRLCHTTQTRSRHHRSPSMMTTWWYTSKTYQSMSCYPFPGSSPHGDWCIVGRNRLLPSHWSSLQRKMESSASSSLLLLWRFMWLWIKRHCKLVHGYLVYTERAPRR